MKHTPGPWVAEKKEDWRDLDNPQMVKTGWIKGVLKYAGCGSHEAKWINEADFQLALAAPDLLSALKAARGNGKNDDPKVWQQIDDAIDKAEGK